MEKQTNSRIEFTRYVRRKGNFINVWGTVFGALCSLPLLLFLGKDGGLGWWLLLVGLALIGGRVWAFCMWFVYKSMYAIDEKKE